MLDKEGDGRPSTGPGWCRVGRGNTHPPKYNPCHWTWGYTGPFSTLLLSFATGFHPDLWVSTQLGRPGEELPREPTSCLSHRALPTSLSTRSQLLDFLGVCLAGATNGEVALRVLDPSPLPPTFLCDIYIVAVSATLSSF